MVLIMITQKGTRMNCQESYYLQNYQKQNLVIKEQKLGELYLRHFNPMYMHINQVLIHTTFTFLLIHSIYTTCQPCGKHSDIHWTKSFFTFSLILKLLIKVYLPESQISKPATYKGRLKYKCLDTTYNFRIL